MHLHRLTFRAIGPFDGEHTIDFDRLGASGLFLLEGPTGAGKSTIIDAIVFALYGGLAGDESSKQRLYSHHAKLGVEPYVDLIFSTQAGDFRIRRSPAHQRPKSRGVGTTVQNESAKLSRLGSLDAPDRGEEVSTRAQEIGNEIKEIVGLDKQQFVQTVVLPQGEFAKFLRSTGEDRKDLLRTIFRTDVYESLTDQLKSMRTRAGKSIEETSARVAEAFAGFVSASEHDFDVEVADSDLEQACVAAAAALGEATSAARSDNDKAQSELAGADTHHDEQVRLAERLRTRKGLHETKALLAQQADGVEGLKERIDQARRASTVSISISGLREAAAHCAATAIQLRNLQSEHGSSDDVDRVALIDQRDQIATEITGLGRLTDVESKIPERRIELVNRSRERADLAKRIEQLRESVALAPEEIRVCEHQVADLTIAAQSLPDLVARVDRADVALEASQAARSTSDLLSEATARLDQMAREAGKANDQVGQLRQRRLDGYAGVLSQGLEGDRPCAVCGSKQHPRPAQLSEDHPSDADIDFAENHLGELTTAVVLARDTVHAHREELARLDEQAGGLQPAQAQTALVEARDKLAVARDAQQRLQSAQTVLDEVKSRLHGDDQHLTQARLDLAVVDAELAAFSDAIDADEAEIIEAVHGRSPSLSRLVQTMRERLELTDRLISARERHVTASSAAASRQVEVDQAITASGFASVRDAEVAVLDAAELTVLVGQVKDYDRLDAQVTDGLAVPEIAALTGKEPSMVDAARQGLLDAQATARKTQKQVDVLTAREASTGRALSNLRGALSTHQAALGASGPIVRLAGVAEGSHPANITKVSLGTYVLMRRFDDVVAAANVRYGPMSNGRYQLVRIEEKEGKGGGRRTGLALAVVDGQTGRQREPRTLSGGETFNASLCLALGLADVVTGEAGGIELGTLFVDEGFGTLDSESLDRVMTELGKLSKGGRKVGIVSHVNELKQRVAERVEVRRTSNGASTLSVMGEKEDSTSKEAV